MRALIFDCDGVLAETERELHLPAFNRAFAEFEVPVCWSEADYGVRLRVSGGKERIAAALTSDLGAAGRPDSRDRSQLIEQLHARKTRIVDELLGERTLSPRPGVVRLIAAASAAGWRIAVASTSAEATVRTVVRQVAGAELAGTIAVFAGDIVSRKKPDPAIYTLALERLGATAEETVVIEDSRNGLVAAHAAGLRCVVTLSGYTAHESFDEAALVLSSLGDPDEPMTVIANRTSGSLSGYVTLSDLEALLQPHGLA